MKRQDKNQMTEFYSVEWHMLHVDQDGSLTGHTESALQ